MNKKLNSQNTINKNIRFNDPKFVDIPKNKEYLDKGDVCILINADNKGFVNYARVEFKEEFKSTNKVTCGILFFTPGAPQLMVGDIPKDALKIKNPIKFNPPGSKENVFLQFMYLPIMLKNVMTLPL